jgi:hypothetical protein
VRGAATNPAGTLAGGVFGGGRNSDISNFGARGSFDVMMLWQLDNLGFGYAARMDASRSEHRLSELESLRVQDRIAAEVSRAHAQLRSARARVGEAETQLKNAVDSVEKNFEGLRQIKRAGEVNLLVIRPQEAVASIQALAQAFNDFFGAVADYNRAQFRLYRALGKPAQHLIAESQSLHHPSSTQ